DRYEHAGNEPYYTEATKRNSSEFNRIEEEARFSSRCAIEDVSGIGNTAGERCSSQASEIWLGVALWRGRWGRGELVLSLRNVLVPSQKSAGAAQTALKEALQKASVNDRGMMSIGVGLVRRGWGNEAA